MGVSWAAAGLEPSGAAATSTSGACRRSRLLMRLGLVRRPVDFPELPSDAAITSGIADAFQGETFRDTGIRAFALISRSSTAIVTEQDGDGALTPRVVVPVGAPTPPPSAQATPEPLPAP